MFEKYLTLYLKVFYRFLFLIQAFALVEVGFNSNLFFYSVVCMSCLWYIISNENKIWTISNEETKEDK